MASTPLTQVISLLYRYADDDRDTLQERLLSARKTAWESALRREAQAHGCPGVPNAPRFDDLSELKRMSREDADSIAATFNRDVEREVERLYETNPRGNRNYYTSNLERWNTARNQWKLPQVALVTDTTTTEYARQRFREMNYPSDTRYVFDGAPPTCPDCTERYAAGIVDETYTRRFPCPRHPGCPHQWVALKTPKLDCADMWRG
jgi:hypothetical protein